MKVYCTYGRLFVTGEGKYRVATFFFPFWGYVGRGAARMSTVYPKATCLGRCIGLILLKGVEGIEQWARMWILLLHSNRSKSHSVEREQSLL